MNNVGIKTRLTEEAGAAALRQQLQALLRQSQSRYEGRT